MKQQAPDHRDGLLYASCQVLTAVLLCPKFFASRDDFQGVA